VGTSTHALFAFSGLPSVIEYGEQLSDTVDHLDVHMRMAAAIVQHDLRLRAASNSHWKPVAEAIEVWADGDTFVVGLRGRHAARAQELEFGGVGTPSRALLRPALAELLPQAQKRFDAALDASGGL
jgi:hypothetical protein